MSRTGWFIIGGFGLLIGLILFVFFEFKERPNVSWAKRYSLQDDQAYGFSSFVAMLRTKYSDQEITLGGSIDAALEKGGPDNLLIIINLHVNLNLKSLEKYLSKDQKVLIISNGITINDNLKVADLKIPDLETVYDSCISYTILDPDKELKGGQYCHYYKNIRRPVQTFLYRYNIEYLSNQWKAITEDDTYSTGIRSNNYKYFACHVEPLMFSNVGVFQDDFLPYFNALFKDVNPKAIHITTSSTMNGANSQDDESAQEHPLEYVMSQPALKYAYYTMLGGVLLYITIGSRRKQRPIKVKNPIKNTSLEYIKALSDVYLSQGQNEKLIIRLEKIFYHSVKTKYFLDKKDDNFIKKLEHKSKISASHISKIINAFSNIEKGFEYNDRQLFDINGLLNYFYRNCK